MKLPRFLPSLGLVTLVAAGAAGLACAKSSAPATTEPTTATPSSDPAPAEPSTPSDANATPDLASIDWEAMSHAEKAQHMKTVVTPAMAKVFQDFDAEHYADFSCATCHGPGAKDGDFEMPTAALPALSAGFEHEKAEHPRDVAFMMEKVVPEMARLLNEPPYDPTTHKGFGCFECHVAKEPTG